MLNILQSMYKKIYKFVSEIAHHLLAIFDCFRGLEQSYLASPILFSVLINQLVNDIIAKARHGATLTHNEIELFLLLFADDLTLSYLPIIGLQIQINNLHASVQRLKLTVNLQTSKVNVFRKGEFLADREK